LCGRNAVQIAPPRPIQLDLKTFAAKIGPMTEVKQNEYLARFTVDGNEITVFADGRAIIKGTDDVAVGRSLYARYVGV